VGTRTSQDDHSQRRAAVLLCPVTVEMRRVATSATLAMHPRDVDFVWGKPDDTGEGEKVKKRVASKRRSCWGILHFPPRPGQTQVSMA
jgi:plasmid replication initiation protein